MVETIFIRGDESLAVGRAVIAIADKLVPFSFLVEGVKCMQ